MSVAQANIYNYCLSTRNLIKWFSRHILSANITFSQCYATLTRQVTVKTDVQSPKQVPKFPFNCACMLSSNFLCLSNADVPTRLNDHVRSVIRKAMKLTKTALDNYTFIAIV